MRLVNRSGQDIEYRLSGGGGLKPQAVDGWAVLAEGQELETESPPAGRTLEVRVGEKKPTEIILDAIDDLIEVGRNLKIKLLRAPNKTASKYQGIRAPGHQRGVSLESLKNEPLAHPNQHVVRHDDGWAVIAEDSERPSVTFTSKQEAIDAAREIAKHSGVEVVVHGLTGQAFRSSPSPVTLNESWLRKAIRSLSTEIKQSDKS